ncbi:hypothetical protein KFK09_025307 [Dendrobium nobile]|uniref:Uncharacterized protein n=1 Tax=Dendrobium nobile TaxID=94219 RepID=A0A8T3AG74_DENNO|nr:hypothetical protein KFK09_025307 [Dendrobium nobile]
MFFGFSGKDRVCYNYVTFLYLFDHGGKTKLLRKFMNTRTTDFRSSHIESCVNDMISCDPSFS